ncbi:probable F420-dependent oxidoreductase, MSMEG_4141 family [Actinacidiphila yanglinensis]|uniref:Probable F420-dependent oxidoreductase, MSMEG_4141 family n=1 Tax=Actinacidiphila yanglinensis TaxID=310779 RepID=A0A1H6D575_9ACTN|nr:TIGR03620 family F420-dependent LLM class oxidoreductase [Actinacidiphila yanglinensis]SEG80517.1 probable F420-dependent oxidoreductase, MSMEG_4141 family [Actinacidiphila yanglinensis]
MGTVQTVQPLDPVRAGVVAAARRALGPVGAVLPVSFTALPPVTAQVAAAVRLERAGYRAAWTNEVVGGKDALVQSALLLAATRRMVWGTAIANLWARPPQTLHAAAAQLAEAYPGRFVLGIGGGYPEQAAAVGREFGSPLATMRGYLERMDAPTRPAAPDADHLRIVAANGPRMLELAGEIADGALPAGLPPQFTARARQVLGPDRLLVVGMQVIPDADHGRAREAARERVAAALARPAYAAGVARLGFPASGTGGVSDRLVDAVVAHGGPDAIAAGARAHLAAGADHVVLLLQPGVDFAAGVDRLEELAPALTGTG